MPWFIKKLDGNTMHIVKGPACSSEALCGEEAPICLHSFCPITFAKKLVKNGDLTMCEKCHEIINAEDK